jgi:hypothetical protein
MYEHHSKPILSKRLFIRRVVKHWLASLAIVVVSLGLGIAGYMITEGISFIDAMLNASMLLGGMGPVTELHTTAGKLFASFYALFSGVIFLILAGVIVAPVAHRMLHHFLKKEAF